MVARLVQVNESQSRDMRSVISQSAASILPAGFAEYFTDLTGAADHNVSFTAGLNANATAVVNTESGGKRRLSTQAHAGGGAAEVVPYYNVAAVAATEHAPTMYNPKTQSWYVEGRAAIETNGANSALFPCSIAATSSGVMVTPITANTFCALGLVGTGFAGGSTTFLSFAAASAGAMVLQTTTIPYTATTQSYSLMFAGGTITARAYAADNSVTEWTTTNLSQVFSGSAGFHPNQWVLATDVTATTMLCDLLYGAGPRT